MATKKLSPKEEKWLLTNYPNMSNRELAEQLTKMIEKENKSLLRRLKGLKEEDFSESARKIIKRQICSLENFSGISEALVKKYARALNCPRKTRKHLVICNQKKAQATNIKRWKKKAEKVKKVSDWLHSFGEKEIRYCFIEGNEQLQQFQEAINKYNQNEGSLLNMSLSSSFIPEVSVLRVRSSLCKING